MATPITFEKFKGYALKLLNNGTKICPCCLSRRITFTTDEDHHEFWLECKACHVGVRHSLFSQTHTAWENRPTEIDKINQITHDIDCEYWDDDIGNTRYVTLEKPTEKE